MPELVVPGVAEAGRIAAVINARSQALHGVTEESAEGVARWFALPSLDPASDMRLAVAADGEPLGYADVGGPDGGGPKAYVDLRTGPDADALQLLFAWAEARAAQRAGAGGVVQFFVDEKDAVLRELLADEGYGSIRSSYEMERGLEGGLEPPTWPEGLDPRRFAVEDAEVVFAAQEEAFADHWGFEPATFESWHAYNLAETEDPSLWCIVWDGDEIAGLCVNRPSRGEDTAVGWVGSLAVRRPWRRRGLGEALLRDAFLRFAQRGKRSAGLGVDAENTTGAVALYERVGMHVVRRSDTWERTV